jgi:hypothetical protein
MKKFFALLLISGIIFPASAMALTSAATDVSQEQSTTEQIFSDVPSTHANYLAINFLSKEGVVKGYSDGTFKPAQLVNRAEALKIILVGNKVEIPASVETVSFSDIKTADWFSVYVMKAKEMGIINGNPDGTYAPARDVSRSEFIKMLLMANGFISDKWTGQELYNDVPKDAWYSPYMNYAGQAGLISADSQNNLYPSQALTRGDVAEILYLMTVIRNGKDTQFLLDQSEQQMAQIEIYIGSQDPIAAKRAAELAVDITQQAYKNMPENNVVLGAAKLARAYDFLVNAYIAGVQKNYAACKDWANQAIAKATEAWEANHDIQPIAKHIKDSANQIIGQIPA